MMPKQTSPTHTDMTIELTEQEFENIAHALHFANRHDTTEQPHRFNYERLDYATLQYLERRFHLEREGLYPKFEEGKTVYSKHYGPFSGVETDSFDVVKRTEFFVWLKNERGETAKRKISSVGGGECTRWGGSHIQP